MHVGDLGSVVRGRKCPPLATRRVTRGDNALHSTLCIPTHCTSRATTHARGSRDPDEEASLEEQARREKEFYKRKRISTENSLSRHERRGTGGAHWH